MFGVITVILGCQDYQITGSVVEKILSVEDTGFEPEEEDTNTDSSNEDSETPQPLDTGSSHELDTGEVIDTGTSFDDTEEADYCTNFNDFNGWNYIGDGNWRVENGILVENRGGLYATVAYLHDFGMHQRYSIEVSTAFEGSLNDYAGIVFALDPNTERYWVARWDDPQGDYNRYQPTGRMEIANCYQATCNILASDDTADLTFPSDGNFASWQLRVDGEHVEVHWQGQLVLSQNIGGIQGLGLVGLYSNDNDGGIYYDDFCVWTD